MKSQPRSYTVQYDSESHWSVLTQMKGSSWPRVFPYCLLNVILMLGLTYIEFGKIGALKISDQGHTFVTTVMSFLLVSRVTMALARYSEARNQVGCMFLGASKFAPPLEMDILIVLSLKYTDNNAQWHPPCRRADSIFHNFLLCR